MESTTRRRSLRDVPGLRAPSEAGAIPSALDLNQLEHSGGAAAIYSAWLAGVGHMRNATPWELALATTPVSTYPGGSKERVRKAGNNVREGTAGPEDYAVIDLWRAAHRPVLNTFQAILRNRTRDTGIVVAQRHKRKKTIFGKLIRYPKMQLSRMDDVAGCRLIFDSLEDLHTFRMDFHEARFSHRRRNEIDKYDYIEHPNPDTGYRGIHDIYEYEVNSQYADKYRGLLIEIQYRTKYQHAWATCVEMIGFITENQPKFREGDKRFQRVLSLASEIIARVFEASKSSHPELPDKELVKQFLALDKEIGFLQLLQNLNAQENVPTKNRNMILIFSPDGDLSIESFRDATDALRALFRLESETPNKDIVLVRADSSEEIRTAFRNYFSDAREFIALIEKGCERLSGKKVVHGKIGPARKRTEQRGNRAAAG